MTPWKSDVTVVTLGPGEVLRDEIPPGDAAPGVGGNPRDRHDHLESKVDRPYVMKFGDGVADEEILNSKDVAASTPCFPSLSPAEIHPRSTKSVTGS